MKKKINYRQEIIDAIGCIASFIIIALFIFISAIIFHN